MTEEVKKNTDEEKTYGCWKCTCKGRHELVVWINMLMSVVLIVYSFFSFINIFAWFGDKLFINVLFPIYYM